MTYRADSPMYVSYRSPSGATVEAGVAHPPIESEITVALPNGIPDRVRISLMGFSHEAVIADGGDNNPVSYQPLVASALAYKLAHAEKSDPTDKREQVKIDKYRFGHTRELTFHLWLTDDISAGVVFHETQFSRKDASVPFDQLPANFRQAVQDAMKQARALANQPKSGQDQPPPPRR